MDRDEIFETLRSLKDLIAKEFELTITGVFGSIARNDYNNNSDVDILFVPGYDYTGKHSAEKFLSDQIGRKVSLCNCYRVSGEVWKSIKKDIIPL